MSFRFAFAVLGLPPPRLSRDEISALSLQEQINTCHEREADARALASSKDPETRGYYLRLANEWAHLAAEIERDYYVLR